MELVIERRWFDQDYTVPATSRAVLFNAFLGFFFFKSSLLFSTPNAEATSPFLVVPFILLATGIFLAYGVATDWLNRTVIVVTPTTISVRHGPLPWPGNKVVPVAGIKRLHVALSQWVRTLRRRRLTTYDLIAETADGQRTAIAGGFRQPEPAKQAMEKFLSIQPAKPTPPDAGELDRRTIDNFLAGKRIEQPRTNVAVRRKSGPQTNLYAVIAFWLFTLFWNGLVWWVIWKMLSKEGIALVREYIAPLSPIVLIGLGLIYWAIPRTIKYFRERDATQSHEKWTKKETATLAFACFFGLIVWTIVQGIP